MAEHLIDAVFPICGLVRVVDVGSNPIDGAPPYLPLLQRRLCRVVGFEPQGAALTELNNRKSDLETYLPYAVGDGAEHTLHLCQAPGMTSVLEPDPARLALFPHFNAWGRVLSTEPVATRRLDAIEEIPAIDFLKIDIQGGELMAFRGGREKLAGAVAIQTEVSFIPLYHGQPSFAAIDAELRTLGFLPHSFPAINRRMILPLYNQNDLYAAMNQVLEADIVYVRDFLKMDTMTTPQLGKLALIAHFCYRSFDLCARCLHAIAERREIEPAVVNAYLHLLPTY